MKYKPVIQNAIDYIEANLKNELTNSEIAAAVGYSEYHFLRIFRQYVHLTPADYIRKRRISEIVRRMAQDKRHICDIAFEYGFNSKENFTRAFKSEHHILPTEFRLSGNSLKLYGRLNLEPTELEIPCTITRLEPFSIIAYASDEDSPPNFWNKYNAGGYSKRLSGGRSVTDYGVCRWNPDKMKLDYLIGIRDEDAAGDRSNTETIDISGGTYAMFRTPAATAFDFVSIIHRTWNYINTVWLPSSKYVRTGSHEFECYIEDSRLFSEVIYIPVESKEQTMK